MALYFHDSYMTTIDTKLSYWDAEAALIDMASDSRSDKSQLAHLYEVSVRKPNFFGKVGVRASYLVPTNEEANEVSGPEFYGSITEVQFGSIIKLTVRARPWVVAFMWVFHIFGVAFASTATYLAFSNGTGNSWPMIAIGLVFASVPVLWTNSSMRGYNREVLADVRKQLLSKEQKKT